MREIIHHGGGMETLLDSFLAGKRRNEWLSTKQMSVYMRKGSRHFPFWGFITTLEIGSVTVRERLRGRGLFKAFLVLAERKNPYKVTLIENVLNPQLETSLRRDGWQVYREGVPPLSYWRPTLILGEKTYEPIQCVTQHKSLLRGIAAAIKPI